MSSRESSEVDLPAHGRPKPSGFRNRMNGLSGRALVQCLTVLTLSHQAVAADLDAIGVSLLRTAIGNVDGAGVSVAIVEASENGTNQPPAFEVNPGSASVLMDPARFAYYSDLGSSNVYPNSVGVVSGHANSVAANLVGRTQGVATNVSHVDNYHAVYFYDTLVNTLSPSDPEASIINQSYIFDDVDVQEQRSIDSDYDNFAAQFNVLFVSGAGNGGQVYSPSTCYNGLSVGAFGGSSSTGPTLDNGRCKPDITAPAGVTSFSTPQVAGAAALLAQAGRRGDGGPETNSAVDSRMLKALLLNGAVKPANWTNSTSSPLDARYGAGVLNVFNSYEQLAGGQHTFIEQSTVGQGTSHPPGNSASNITSRSGWDFNSLSSTVTSDRINHYYFSLESSLVGPFTATATLVWNRQQNETAINNLDLFLYDVSTGLPVEESVSQVDNVEQLYIESLPAGRYDLQVLKRGGTRAEGRLTTTETYALAWEFFLISLTPSFTESGLVLTWPIYPDGFVLESSAAIGDTQLWQPVESNPVLTNGVNRLEVPHDGSNAFFRLRRP